MDGVLIIDKPVGPTSHDVVSIVKRVTGARKVGHLGTLDPSASGVLPLALNAATKKSSELSGDEKVYEFQLCLGAETETDDDAGAVLRRAEVPEDAWQRLQEILPQFVGNVLQRPPRYSAVKVNGQRAYSLARKGIAFELDARLVRIDSIDVLSMRLPEIALRMRCGSGTYVRSLCRDLGRAIGCGGYAKAIRRTRSGGYTVEHSIPLQHLIDASKPWWETFIPLK